MQSANIKRHQNYDSKTGLHDPNIPTNRKIRVI